MDEHQIKAQLDQIVELLRTIGHRVPHTPDTHLLRWHVEFAAAFLREAWIAADGQNPQSVEDKCADCLKGKRLDDWAAKQPRQALPLQP